MCIHAGTRMRVYMYVYLYMHTCVCTRARFLMGPLVRGTPMWLIAI